MTTSLRVAHGRQGRVAQRVWAGTLANPAAPRTTFGILDVMSIVTTGRDVVAETHAFNETLAATLSSVPRPYEADDVAALRKAPRGLPPVSLRDEAQERRV